jgi:hypothetical protein
MEYTKIIAVTGLPGLYELLSSKSDGAIVRSLDDKSTKFVSSRIHNFSHLESIEVYTVRDNVNLVTILKAMEDSTEKKPDEKDNAALKNYFSKVFPDLDFERVYSSDLKKMVKWYTVLKNNNVELKLTEVADEQEEPETAIEASGEKTEGKKAVKEKQSKEAREKTTDKAADNSPVKKTSKDAAASEKAKAEPVKEAAVGEKPKAKKAPAKKKAEEDEKEKAPAEEKPKKAVAKKK